MKSLQKFWIAACFVLASGALVAQSLVTKFVPSTTQAAVGDLINVQFQVSNFNGIVSLQLPITYTASTLQFVGIDNPALPNYADTTAAHHPNAGKISVIWIANPVVYPQGVSFPDHKNLMTLVFKVIGAGTAVINVNPDVFPYAEVVDAGYQEHDVDYRNGGANINTGAPHIFKVEMDPALVSGAQIGQIVPVRVVVSGFDQISSVQLPILYSNGILQLHSVKTSALPGYVDTLASDHPQTGKMVLAWFADPANYPNGLTRADGTTILTLNFKVIGYGTGLVQVLPVSPGIEVTDHWDHFLQVDHQNALAKIVSDNFPPVICDPGANPPPAPVYSGFKVAATPTYIPQGQYGCMPIRVYNFDNIVTLLFATHWDPTLFEFDCVRNFNLPNLPPTVNNNIPGTVLVGWDDPSASGVNRANGTAIFEVCFRAIGAPGAGSLVNFNAVGFPGGVGNIPEAYNASAQNMWNNSLGGTAVPDSIFVTDPAVPQCSVVFEMEKDSVSAGEETCLDVRANNFYWMTNAEFNIGYDPALLGFKKIELGANPLNLKTGGLKPNFSFSSGDVHFTWENTASTNGVSLADKTVLFSVCFNAPAAQNETALIEIKGTPCAGIGASRKNMGGVPVFLSQGLVHTKLENNNVMPEQDTIGEIVYGNRLGNPNNGTGQNNSGAVFNALTIGLQSEIFPNPLSETANLQFFLAQPEAVEVAIFDFLGKNVYKKSVGVLPTGKHGMKIDKDMLPEKGIYYLTIRTTTQQAVHTLFKI